MKNIKDYLHFYIGQLGRCSRDGEWGSWETILDKTLGSWRNGPWDGIQLMLRPLSSMTEKEEKEMDTLMYHGTDGVHVVSVRGHSPESFRWLLEKGFDIFELEKEGLALSIFAARVEEVQKGHKRSFLPPQGGIS